MASPCDRILQLVAARLPDATVDVRTFSSGSVLIDVHVGGEVLVVEHRPGVGYGISILSSDASDESDGFTGHPHVFGSQEDVLERLDLICAERHLRAIGAAPRGGT